MNLSLRLLGSCVLVNNDLKHRVLINKNTSINKIYEYSLFSCYLDKNSYCDFEEVAVSLETEDRMTALVANLPIKRTISGEIKFKKTDKTDKVNKK